MKVIEGDILFVEDGVEEFLHFLWLVEEHLLFETVDERIDVGGVLDSEFGGLGVFGRGD